MALGSAQGGRSAPRVCEPSERQTRVQAGHRLEDRPRRGKGPRSVRKDILPRRRRTPPNAVAAHWGSQATRSVPRPVHRGGPWRSQTTRSGNCPTRPTALPPDRCPGRSQPSCRDDQPCSSYLLVVPRQRVLTFALYHIASGEQGTQGHIEMVQLLDVLIRNIPVNLLLCLDARANVQLSAEELDVPAVFRATG